MARHCSDEQLLALRDGELGWVSRLLVGRHIQSCWLCRGRLNHLEAQLRVLAEAWLDQSAAAARQTEAARRRFLAWAHTSGVRFERGRRLELSRLKHLRGPALAAAGTVALAATLVVWQYTPEPPKQPQQPQRPLQAAAVIPRAAPPPRARAPVRAAPRLVPSAVPTSLSMPTAIELLEAEIEARYVLHRAGSCRGEPIEVSVDDGWRVLIHGVVSSLDRKRVLTDLLQEAPGSGWVALDLRAVEELPAAPENLPPSSVAETPPPSRDRDFQRALAAHFRSAFPSEEGEALRQRITAVGNEALRKADAALAEAWALRRLQERFAPESLAGVRPEVRRRAEAMARDHAAALRTATAEIRALLEPIFASLPRTEPSAATPDETFPRIQRMQLLIDELFGGLAAPGRTPDQTLADLMAVMEDRSLAVAAP